MCLSISAHFVVIYIILCFCGYPARGRHKFFCAQKCPAEHLRGTGGRQINRRSGRPSRRHSGRPSRRHSGRPSRRHSGRPVVVPVIPVIVIAVVIRGFGIIVHVDDSAGVRVDLVVVFLPDVSASGHELDLIDQAAVIAVGLRLDELYLARGQAGMLPAQSAWRPPAWSPRSHWRRRCHTRSRHHSRCR